MSTKVTERFRIYALSVIGGNSLFLSRWVPNKSDAVITGNSRWKRVGTVAVALITQRRLPYGRWGRYQIQDLPKPAQS